MLLFSRQFLALMCQNNHPCIQKANTLNVKNNTCNTSLLNVANKNCSEQVLKICSLHLPLIVNDSSVWFPLSLLLPFHILFQFLALPLILSLPFILPQHKEVAENVHGVRHGAGNIRPSYMPHHPLLPFACCHVCLPFASDSVGPQDNHGLAPGAHSIGK